MDALLSGTPLPQGAGSGKQQVAQVPAKNSRIVIFFSDGTMAQQGPLNTREVKAIWGVNSCGQQNTFMCMRMCMCMCMCIDICVYIYVNISPDVRSRRTLQNNKS